MKLLQIVVLTVFTMLINLPSAMAAENKGGLFINLTTDDTWAAAK